MPAPDQPVYITQEQAQRIADAVRRVEEMFRDVMSRARPPSPYAYGILRAKVTTAIPTGSLTSPSSDGRVQIRHLNAGTWEDVGDPVVCWNDNTLSASLPVNRVVKVAWISGAFWLISASCT